MADTAEPTNAEIAEFMTNLAYWRHADVAAADTLIFEYDRVEAGKFRRARPMLEAMRSWSVSAATEASLQHCSALLRAKMESAVVTDDRVRFQFTGAEMATMRTAASLVANYVDTLASDRSQRGKRSSR